MEKKKIIVCGGGAAQAQKDALLQQLVNVHNYTVLTIDEAREQGIDMSDVVVIDENRKPMSAITITALMPVFERMEYTHYADDVKRSKGHERPYRFHR
jgi:hypothetical protein